MSPPATTTAERRTTTQPRSTAGTLPPHGRARVVIESVAPRVDCGRFPAKRSAGEPVRVECDAFTDGHDKISVALRHRRVGTADWHEIDMAPLVSDRWAGEFEVHAVGWHEFTVAAWVDRFATWRYDLSKRVAAGQNVAVDLQIGAKLVEEAAAAAEGEVGRSLSAFATFLRTDAHAEATELALGESLANLMRRHAPRQFTTEWPEPVRVWVDRAKARFS